MCILCIFNPPAKPLLSVGLELPAFCWSLHQATDSIALLLLLLVVQRQVAVFQLEGLVAR
jgi:hypothetical protein